jgi:SNF2 family DNA or RNA helicase
MNPFVHQQETFDRTKDLPGFAYLWEMRVGKTLPTLMTAEYLFQTGKIEGVLVFAPNGVHLNWSRKAIPEFLEDKNFQFVSNILEWNSGKVDTKTFQTKLKELMTFPGCTFFCVNVESIYTDKCEKILTEYCIKRKILLLCDESHKLKTPSAKCTKAAIRLSKLCPFKRTLTGTPLTQGPFDLWSQFHILDPMIFHTINSDGTKFPMRFTAYKQRFGVFKRMRYGAGPAFDQLVEYRDLETLYSMIQPYSSRLAQADVFDFLPKMVIEQRLFEMSPTQKKAYEELKCDLRTQLSSGQEITAQQVIVGLLRMQQISRGFVGWEDENYEKTTVDLGNPKPSITALMDILEQVEGKAIVWCRFKADVTAIMEALEKEKIKAVRYDGSVETSERPDTIKRFETEAKFLVGTPATGGTGLDLSCADTMVFYSHGCNLGERLQAIARMQGPNQKSKSLLLIDLVAVGTYDQHYLDLASKKEDLADSVTHDRMRALLREAVESQ